MNRQSVENKLEIGGTRSERTGKLSDYVSRDELESLNNYSTARVVLDGMLIWGVILGALAIAVAVDSWPITFLCFIVIATRQLALTHMVHDASHLRLFSDRKLNDLVSDWFFAAPVMITTQQYRAQHLLHHKHLGHSQLDTDRRAWYSIRGLHFVRRSAQILLGGEALQTFMSYTNHEGDLKQKNGNLVQRLVQVGITNAILLAYCAWLGDPLSYFYLWLLPMFTLTMYLLTLRVIAEHQTVDYALQGIDAFNQDVQNPLIRTLEPGPLGRFFLGSLNFFYHHEHHLAPSVRYANLPKLHALLLERGYYQRYPEALGTGYLATLRDLIFPADATTSPSIGSADTLR